MRKKSDKKRQRSRRSVLGAAAGLGDTVKLRYDVGYDGKTKKHTRYITFLELLAGDNDTWKQELMKNPDKVLARYGIVFKPSMKELMELPLKVLPDKHEVKTFLDAMMAHEDSELGPRKSHIFHLWSGITTGGR